MGLDLVQALLFITTCSLIAFRVGLWIGSFSTSTSSRVFVESLVFTIAFVCFFAGDLAWAKIIPNSGVLTWTNLVPIFLSLAAGVSGSTVGLRHWQRSAVKSGFLLLSAIYLLTPVVRPQLFPATVDVAGTWKKDVCLQSHEATCAPAAAATLLRQHGITVDELQMVTECLSSNRGTVPLGLYRGIARVAEDHGRQAKIASRTPWHWIDAGQLPNVAIVSLHRVPLANARPHQRLTAMLGPQAEGHAVTILGRSDGGRWIVGDPAVGLVTWSDEELKSRFTGDAIFVE